MQKELKRISKFIESRIKILQKISDLLNNNMLEIRDNEFYAHWDGFHFETDQIIEDTIYSIRKKKIKSSLINYPNIQNAEKVFYALFDYLQNRNLLKYLGLKKDNNMNIEIYTDYHISKKNLCGILNVSRQTLNNWIDKGNIKCYNRKTISIHSLFSYLYLQAYNKLPADLIDKLE